MLEARRSLALRSASPRVPTAAICGAATPGPASHRRRAASAAARSPRTRALPKTKQNNVNPHLIEYYNRNLAQWQGGLTDPLLKAAQRTAIQNDLTTILGLVNGAVNGRTINGTAKYRANIFANYYRNNYICVDPRTINLSLNVKF
jgi:hypothetical protein